MRHLLTCILVLIFSHSIIFATELQDDKSLSQQTNDIKAEVIELNKDLFLLEEDLLHPVSTRLALYVSMDLGRFFTLESVKIKLDGKQVSSFLYTKKDVDALKRGAIQPLYLANITSGKHELVAVFTGIGTHNVAYKRAVTMNFEKKQGEKSLEIQIVDDPSSQQAQFKIKAWN